MKVERCKGMRDLLPLDMEKFRNISDKFRELCVKWGYEEVRTPTLEYLHLFTSAGTLTPGMLNKVYSFLDWDGWSGERVVLRPDATIPVARLFTEGMTDLELAKLFYIVNTFIFEAEGKQNRERWQLGAELIGMGSPMADVELITLSVEVLKRLGFDGVELKLSHAGLTRGILQKLGLDSEEQNLVFDRLLDGEAGALSRIQEERPELVPLLSLQGKSSAFISNIASSLALDLSELKPQIEDFAFIADTLRALGYEFQIDVASVRGFEYYTGMIFQLFIKNKKVGGGGRYDALIPAMSGKNIPASGFGLYLDLLMGLITPETAAAVALPKILLKMHKGAEEQGFAIADQLREAGYIVKFYLGGKGPADTAWELEVRKQAPHFVMTDKNKKTSFNLRSTGEVLNRLRS